MVVIQLGGQFLLYPSAFVGIPLDEMIDPFPAKKPGTTTMNEQTCNEILVGNFSDLPENTQCVSTLKSGYFIIKITLKYFFRCSNLKIAKACLYWPFSREDFF